MNGISRRLIFSILFCTAAFSRAEAPAPTTRDLFDPARYMRVSEVRPGMTGYGLSVFSGSKIEKFDVEVISVLKNFNPKDDVVLIRCRGANLEHTGAIAGMSGSPIYLKDDQGRDRMIGAFAYGWPLVKDPIAGVQPIEYMLALPDNPPVPATNPAADSHPAFGLIRWSLGDSILLPGMKQAPAVYPLASLTRLEPNVNMLTGSDDSSRLQPLATPLMTAGLSSRVLDQLAPLFRAYGLTVLQSGGIASGAATTQPADAVATIAPGSVLAAPLMTGDVDMTAIGTCTEVVGDRIFGFGHPFNNEGKIDLPFGAGEINAIVAELRQSFKLGAMTRTVGSLTADESVGVSGRLGAAPPMMPIEIHVVYTDGSQDLTYHFQSVMHPKFTPMLGTAAIAAALTGRRELPPYHTVDYDLKLEFENGRTLALTNTITDSNPAALFFAISGPMVAAAENPFERVLPTRLTGTLRVTPETREAEILSVNLTKLKYKPGDVVKASVQYRPFRSAEATMPVELTLPRDLPDGIYQMVVSGWERYLQDEQTARPFRFTAENSRDVFDVLRDFLAIRHDAVYVRLVRQADGVALGRTAMPRLPSSVREVLLDAGRSNTTPFISSEVKIFPGSLVMDGAADFAVTIEAAGHTEARAGQQAAPVPPTPNQPGARPAPAGSPIEIPSK